ncbi:Zn-dependent hydrolase of the beta-lactamase fold-like protein [Natronococcus amylolyticus DSM 10524]|uniref:Zn-dependent hydrolase of the beta-lactamase fold-like protein n=1 Tax=Natronococcus amylolyticus DSM 10524 TaxID=1227497 RepID=L9X447_9EURY|nr:MBL fold metallo-hydrolase [Natronococcus amylolyticus]ELY56524.1 Zn-dependent hydrolase of the beta-lactamase fold-like protein [Natronococcus amylolyticus DSM 10524]
MRVTYLESAAILVESEDASILCDPWLVDGAYYGSWAHYPEPEFEPEDFNDVDYIYISHIHPDHFDPDTLRRIDTDIPILIHDYRWDYLKDDIEELGYEVLELPHDERVHLTGKMHINVLAADGCDPELCGNYFGCSWYDSEADSPGSTQVDSMAVIDDGEFTIVDTNDVPFAMAESSCRKVKHDYGEVDLLCHQYSAAQFYPQAVTNYSHEKKIRERDRVIREKHELALDFIDVFEPAYYMPFAGEYVLAGDLAHLNEYTANPPREEALDFFEHAVDPDDHECVFLNSGEYIDLETGERSSPFEPADPEEKQRYITEELAERSFDYEANPIPSLSALQAYVPYAYESLEQKRKKIDYSSDTTVLISMVDDVYLEVSMNGGGYRYVSEPDLDFYSGYVKMDIDPRLLKCLFEGPHSAYWADAKIGSHLGISKQPDIYERGLFLCLGSFHAHGYEVSVPANKAPDATVGQD